MSWNSKQEHILYICLFSAIQATFTVPVILL